MNPLLAWELNWVASNSQRYDSPMHVVAVQQNIIKQYRIRELEREIAELKKKPR